VLLERLAGIRDVLLRAATERHLSLTLRVPIVTRLLPESSESQKRDLATNLMADCLRAHFGGDELATLSLLFDTVGQQIDGGWVVRTGLDSLVATSVVNRNLVAFDRSRKQTRECILAAIEELAERLAARLTLDLDETAASACASLLWDAQSVNLTGLLRGAGRLLPNLFQSGEAQVSAIVAATFPLIYLELAKEDDVPSLFKFVPFFDWDRCKAARRELVETFLSSETWRPCDLALTACRASDVTKILRRVARSYRGKSYISRVAADLKMLPGSYRNQVKQTILNIQSDYPP